MPAKTKAGKDSQKEDVAVVPRREKASMPADGGTGGKRRKKKGRGSKSKRAGITFPVAKVISRMKKQKVGKRISVGAGVYAAAVMEYLAAEVLDLAGNAAKDNKKKRIVPRHIHLAVRQDHELNALLGDVTISQGVVIPFIHQSLIKKKGPKDAESQEY